MRNKFGEWILEAAANNPSFILLSGDIGFGIFDKFIAIHPDKFINCGIAEQNMIGVAAGLAARGYKPYVYTIIPFLVYRPFEFVRNLIAYQNLGVVLVGVGGGFSYDLLGYTHYALEDLALISSLPNFKIHTPFDPRTSEKCFWDSLNSNSPSYIRLMKGGERNLDYVQDREGFTTLIDYGDNFSILTHGSIVDEAVTACNELKNKYGLNGKVIAILHNKNIEGLSKLELNKSLLIVVEEHVYPGLLFPILVKLGVIENNNNALLINVNNEIELTVSNRNMLIERNNLDSSSIVSSILLKINK